MALSRDDALGLLLRHRRMILAYAYSILRSPDSAEDVFQEVALVVTSKHEDIKDETSFPAWVRTITRYRSLDAIRRRKSNAVVFMDESTLQALEQHWVGIDEPMFSTTAVEALRECLKELTAHSQRLVNLRFDRGKNCGAIAKQLGRPVATVYVAFSRIYRALGRCIEARLSGEEVVNAE